MSEKTTGSTEVLKDPQYTHKSFELAFTTFSGKYAQKLEPLTGRTSRDGSDQRFMGLPAGASVQQMRLRLDEVAKTIGDAPGWGEDQQESASMQEAVLLSSRYLAWHATMGGITQQYMDRLDSYLKAEEYKGKLGGGGHQNIGKLRYERSNAVAYLLGQNHALRDYFDSALAKTLGNDSPEEIRKLLEKVPFHSAGEAATRASGISLEIASKRHLETVLKNSGLEGLSVAYGSDDQDSRAGDLVLMSKDEVMFIDLKSSMPARFADGTTATPEDYERGYKWIDSKDQELKVVAWAYSGTPVESERFELADTRLGSNLELLASALQ